MKVYNYLLVFSIFFLFSFKNIDEQPKEFIQSKIEENSLKELVILGEKLQSIDTLSKFYSNRSYELAWDRMSASQLIFAIQQASDEGLNSNDYHIEPIITFIQNTPTTASAIAENDLLLTDAFLLYANHLMYGKVNPKKVDPEWHYPTSKKITVDFLDSLLVNNKVNEIINYTAPNSPIYQNLKNSLCTYSMLSMNEWTNIGDGPTIKKGMEDERIPSIREHLLVLGDLVITDTLRPKVYNDTLVSAIKQFQKRHGLTIDGSIGKNTLKILNLSIAERYEKIKANMERMRWAPKDLGAYYIQVNIPEFKLELIKNDTLLRTHNVIVGKPTRRTPLFNSTMEHVVLNPTWTVPPGIRKKDIIPGIKKNANYLKKKNLVVMDPKGNYIDATNIDWDSKASKKYKFRQLSGPGNALGAVKFMFPNNLFIYIHDTPSKSLFNKSQRAYSSGCIRVKDPLILAKYILNDNVKWNEKKIYKIVKTGKLKSICLIQQPDVHLFYYTAWTDQNNTVQFREDIYKLDNLLIEKMNKEINPIQEEIENK